MTHTDDDERALILALSFWPTGAANSGWRSPEASNTGIFSPALLEDAARTAERGIFDYLFFGNTESSDASRPDLVVRRAFQLEGLSAAGFAAAATRDIGVIASINTSYADPYSVAHSAATVDHLSRGRFGLNMVTGAPANRAFTNFSLEGHIQGADKYQRAREFTQVLGALQDSWADDWYLDDRPGGRLFDPEASRRIDFEGEVFRVSGPLNAPRPPQGRVPLVHAGTSDASFEFGAEFADLRFSPFYSREWNQDYARDKWERAARYGRDRSEHRIVCGVVFYPGATREDAVRSFRRVEEAVVAEYGPASVSTLLRVDPERLRPHTRVVDLIDVDTLMPPVEEAATGTDQNLAATPLDDGFDGGYARAVLQNAFDAYGSREITVLDLYRFLVNKPRFPVVVGGPREIADWIEDGYASDALDGVKFFPPYSSGPLHDFVDHVVPELQRRGIARTRYRGTTLRDHLGLPRPDLRTADLRAAAAGRAAGTA